MYARSTGMLRTRNIVIANLRSVKLPLYPIIYLTISKHPKTKRIAISVPREELEYSRMFPVL